MFPWAKSLIALTNHVQEHAAYIGCLIQRDGLGYSTRLLRPRLISGLAMDTAL